MLFLAHLYALGPPQEKHERTLLLEDLLLRSCLGNPHSCKESQELIERSRRMVLPLGVLVDHRSGGGR